MWGSVCNEHFTIEAANVVCRQLGFDQALDYTPGGYFGQSTGPIHMSNVTCIGNELTIADCIFSTTHSCDHTQDVGIFCQGTYIHMYSFLCTNIIRTSCIIAYHIQTNFKFSVFFMSSYDLQTYIHKVCFIPYLLMYM